MTLMKRQSDQRIIVAFSGTKGEDQLIEEVSHMKPKKYDLHPGTKAQVFEFFYKHYLQDFRETLQAQISKILNDEELNSYSLTFTGHSLGGALAVHAAADTVLSYDLSSRKIEVYTFGQPRVGNSQFINLFLPHLSSFYRVVHNKDIVPHLPPCISDFNNGCIKSGPLIPVFPYHAPTEVFYQEGMAEFTVCSPSEGEDSSCSDSVKAQSVPDHLEYFGVRVGQLWNRAAGDGFELVKQVSE